MGKAARLNRERLIAKGVDLNQPYKNTFTVEEVLIECRKQHGIGLFLANKSIKRIAYLPILSSDIAKDGHLEDLEDLQFLICQLQNNHIFVSEMGLIELPIDPMARDPQISEFANSNFLATQNKFNISDAVKSAVIIPEGKFYYQWMGFALWCIKSLADKLDISRLNRC